MPSESISWSTNAERYSPPRGYFSFIELPAAVYQRLIDLALLLGELRGCEEVLYRRLTAGQRRYGKNGSRFQERRRFFYFEHVSLSGVVSVFVVKVVGLSLLNRFRRLGNSALLSRENVPGSLGEALAFGSFRLLCGLVGGLHVKRDERCHGENANGDLRSRSPAHVVRLVAVIELEQHLRSGI